MVDLDVALQKFDPRRSLHLLEVAHQFLAPPIDKRL
jgi:hypothetical protein